MPPGTMGGFGDTDASQMTLMKLMTLMNMRTRHSRCSNSNSNSNSYQSPASNDRPGRYP
jgi:hypothetical protein